VSSRGVADKWTKIKLHLNQHPLDYLTSPGLFHIASYQIKADHLKTLPEDS
jgi:hypothetical protein